MCVGDIIESLNLNCVFFSAPLACYYEYLFVSSVNLLLRASHSANHFNLAKFSRILFKWWTTGDEDCSEERKKPAYSSLISRVVFLLKQIIMVGRRLSEWKNNSHFFSRVQHIPCVRELSWQLNSNYTKRVYTEMRRMKFLWLNFEMERALTSTIRMDESSSGFPHSLEAMTRRSSDDGDPTIAGSTLIH